MHTHPYRQLLIMCLVSFATMYILMYAMVDSWTNVYPNLNQFYMASLMTAAMVIIELVVMHSMYPNKRLTISLITGAAIALALFFLLIQQQTAISDQQFLKSMIPHHGAAVLMCKQVPIQDKEIQQLCTNIVSSQQSEIDWMKAQLGELENE